MSEVGLSDQATERGERELRVGRRSGDVVDDAPDQRTARSDKRGRAGRDHCRHNPRSRHTSSPLRSRESASGWLAGRHRVTQPRRPADHQSLGQAVAGQLDMADESVDQRPQDDMRPGSHEEAGGCAAQHETEAATASRERLGCCQPRADSGSAQAAGNSPKRGERD